MQLDERSACATDLVFDQWFGGEHTKERVSQLQAHLQTCTRCRLRGELIERERVAFLTKAPTMAANASIVRQAAARRAPARASFARSSWYSVAALAGLTLIAVVVGVLPAVRSRMPEPDGERRKGGFQVGFFVKRGGEVRRGASGEVVYPGDLLRFTYSSEHPMYLALLGRDAHDASVYFPLSGPGPAAEAARVAPGSEQALDFSLELDAQLGTERLFAVSCPTPFALRPLQQALLHAGELKPGADCRVEQIALQKQAPP
jgi:hypothetical protein